MARPSKRLTSMRANPAGDWTIADVEAVCREHGLDCDKPTGSSHYVVSHPAIPRHLTVPFARPIKVVYIRRLVKLIDDVRSHDETAGLSGDR